MDAASERMQSMGISGSSGTLAQEMMSGYVEKRGLILPTPYAGMDKGNNKWNEKSQGGKGLTAMAANGMLPKPIGYMIQDSYQKTDGGTFRLSLLFTEEMMGFPLGWTTFPFLSGNGEPSP